MKTFDSLMQERDECEEALAIVEAIIQFDDEELRELIAKRLLTSYRFVLAYPNSLDTVGMDAMAMLEEIKEYCAERLGDLKFAKQQLQ
jgi:hypothetical protein